jgi:hypothetical protein
VNLQLPTDDEICVAFEKGRAAVLDLVHDVSRPPHNIDAKNYRLDLRALTICPVQLVVRGHADQLGHVLLSQSQVGILQPCRLRQSRGSPRGKS